MTRKVTVENRREQREYRNVVLEWNDDETAASVVSTHSSWDRALEAAFEYARMNGRYFRTAEIVPLRPAKEVLF